MKDRILCAIDFSEPSREALRWSVNLARKLKSDLTVLYTYRLMKAKDGEPLAMKKNIENEAQKNFNSLEKDILSGNDISYEFKSEVGFVADRVKEHSRKNDLSFVVIARDSQLNRDSIDDLMSSVQVPVVLVP